MKIPADKGLYFLKIIERTSKAIITGTKDQIKDAKRMINDMLDRCPSRRDHLDHSGVRERTLGRHPPLGPPRSSLEVGLYYDFWLAAQYQ
ncbi:hypothetical protein AAG906_037793 [Vitis piasezkii]